MKEMKYKVEGMTCEHCTMHVKEALEALGKVKSAKVSLKKAEVTIKAEETIDFDTIQTAVETAGYKLRS